MLPAPQPSGFDFPQVYRAYQSCRRSKRNKPSALAFEANHEENLVQLEAELRERRYQPGTSICFYTRKPKAREIFAADFRDRIVHQSSRSSVDRDAEGSSTGALRAPAGQDRERRGRSPRPSRQTKRARRSGNARGDTGGDGANTSGGAADPGLGEGLEVDATHSGVAGQPAAGDGANGEEARTTDEVEPDRSGEETPEAGSLDVAAG